LFALFSTDETVVPGLVGVTIEEAADLLEAEVLVLDEVTFTDTDPEAGPGTVVSSAPESEEPAGVVIAQDPSPRTEVPVGMRCASTSARVPAR
jgi:beta-lactam-binding protein with PASTA domain